MLSIVVGSWVVRRHERRSIGRVYVSLWNWRNIRAVRSIVHQIPPLTSVFKR